MLIALSSLLKAIIIAQIWLQILGDLEVCDGFMALVAGKYPWRVDESCVESIVRLQERFFILSQQMIMMKANLTVFVSHSNYVICDLKLPNIIVQSFDAKELLIHYGFGEAIDSMNKWRLKSYTRTSDLLRILLARRFRMTYIDTDIHFLNTSREVFFRPFVGAAIWSDVKCGIELTNSAFCLQSNVLDEMIEFLRLRIGKGSSNYQYTELGPAMFQKLLMNKNFAVSLYSQNHPVQSTIDDIYRSYSRYHHTHLHLTGHIRKGHLKQSKHRLKDITPYSLLISDVRARLALPPILAMNTTALTSEPDSAQGYLDRIDPLSWWLFSTDALV